jgi:hypothetical protein
MRTVIGGDLITLYGGYHLISGVRPFLKKISLPRDEIRGVG